MSARDIAVVFRKELRETLRDRRTVAVMVLFPLVAYPLLSLLMVQVMASKQAAGEAQVSRVAVTAVGTASDDSLASVRALLGERPKHDVEVLPAGAVTDAAVAAVAAGKVDAVVEILPPPASPGPRPVRIIYDETRDPSTQAHTRVEQSLAAAHPVGCAPSYGVESKSVAPRRKVGAFVLSKVLPLIVVVMTMLGAFYPAIDVTAGERERGTLETLLASPVSRYDLMTGKVLAVTALAALTGTLNIFSMSLTITALTHVGGGAPPIVIPWTHAAATLLTVIPTAFLFAAVLVAVGAVARSFKEAQNLLAPVYLLCLAPSMVAGVADFKLTGPAMVVPSMNVTLLARDLMMGQASLPAAVVVLVTTLAFGALALAFAARLYDSERLLTASDGTDRTSLGAWFARLFARGQPGAAAAPPAAGPSAEHALLLFAVAFLLWFFVFSFLQRWRMVPGLLLSQWAGFGGLVLVYARLCRRPLRDVIGVGSVLGSGPGRLRPRALAGAVLLGLSSWVILSVLSDWLMPPPRELVEAMRQLVKPRGGDRPLVVSLFVLAVTPAVCEEALFRGPILQGLRRRFPVPAACLVTGLLFGVLHGDVWRFVPTSLLGTLLSWVTVRSGSIVPAMVLHACNNGVLVALGSLGLDEAAEHLSPRVELGLLAAAALCFAAGVLAVRGGAASSAGRPDAEDTL
jgi:sodium transport system permease protein